MSGESPIAGINFSKLNEFSSLVGDNDPELQRVQEIKQAREKDQFTLDESFSRFRNVPASIGEENTTQLIQSTHRKLRERYPSIGIKQGRVITSEVLMKAPVDYFDRYATSVAQGVTAVQNSISTQGRSAPISDAQNNPTDDTYQDEAWRLVHEFASDFADSHGFRGLDKVILINLIGNEIVGFGRLDPLWRDRSIDEIICNGPRDIQVEISGRMHRIPSCKFDSPEHLSNLIDRLYNAIGKRVSIMSPREKGRLHDNSRMYAVHPSIAPGGPLLNIRRHPERFWTPADMVERGSASIPVMETIGNLIYKGATFLVVGETSTGKTSMLNALTGFYRPDVRILTLEDNIELKPNPNKMIAPTMECRDPRPDQAGDYGVSMRDLVKSSLQMRPDVIVVGEVTDGAAYDLCQALNTGHAGASTVHANSESEAIPRLMSLVGQGGIVDSENSLPLIAASFDFIVYLKHWPIDGSRRISSVVEIPGYPSFDQANRPYLDLRPLWRFEEHEIVDGKVVGDWVKMGDISTELTERRNLHLEPDLTWDELKELSRVDGQ